MVAFDSVGPAGGAGIGNLTGIPLSWTHTVVAGPAAVVATASMGIGPDTGMSLSATIDGAAMTAGTPVHANGATAGIHQNFYATGISTGAHTIVVTPAGPNVPPNALAGGSIAFSAAGAFGTEVTATGAATPATLVHSANTNGNLICATVGDGSGGEAATGTGTLRWKNNPGTTAFGDGNGAGSTVPATGGSVTCSFSTTTDWWGLIAVEVQTGSTGPPARGSLPLSRRSRRSRRSRWQLPWPVPSVASGPVLNVTAGLATGTGAAQGASAGVAPRAQAATGSGLTGTSSHFTGLLALSSFTASQVALGVSAGLATGTGAALNPAVAVTVPAGLATGAGAAQNPVGQVAVSAPAGLATGIGAAQNPVPAAGPHGGLATGTGAAPSPAAAAGVNAGLAFGIGAAQSPSVVVGLNAPAGLASGTGAAPSPVPAAGVNAGLATGTGAAQSATVSTASSANAPAGLATGVGAALDAVASAGARPTAATGTGAAQSASASAGANTGLASGTGAAQPSLASAGANAGLATSTGVSQSPAASAGARAGLATGTGAAQSATAALGVSAGLATGTGVAFGGVPAAGARAGLAPGIGAAFDTTVSFGGVVVHDTDTCHMEDSGFAYPAAADIAGMADAGETIGVHDFDSCRMTEFETSAFPSDSDVCKVTETQYWSGPLSDTDAFHVADGGEQIALALQAETVSVTEAEALDVWALQPAFRWSGSGFRVIHASRVLWEGPRIDRGAMELVKTLSEAQAVHFVHDTDSVHAAEATGTGLVNVTVTVTEAVRVQVSVTGP